MLLLFALIVGNASVWAEEVTIASFNYPNSNEGWTVTNPNDYGTGGGGYYILYSGASIVTPSINWSGYENITITISARKYGGPDATQGKISVSQGETELASYSPSGTSIVASSALSISPTDGTITISCPGASSSKGCGVQSIVIKGTEKASTSPLASITLSGDYPTSFFVGDAFSHEGMTVTATYEDNSTKDVTSKAQFSGYDMATVSSSQEVTVSYTEGEVTKTASYQIEVKAIPTHEVTWSVNGTTSSESYQEGANISFPANPADIEGKTFVGWVTEAITGTTDEAPTFVTSATMGTEALTFYAVFAEKTPGTQTTVTDVLTSAITGVTGTGSYSDWSDKTVTSDAVYAGNSAKSSIDAIQMRSDKSTSGIISTTSGGMLKSVTVTWTDGNTSGRSLDIYGSNTAYSAATDLYDSKKQGTKLGSITYKTSTSLTISGDYAYIGLRSNNGALYLADISIEWIAGTPDTYSAYCTTVAVDNRQEAGISFAEATVTKEIVDNYTGQTLNNPNNVSPITWTSSNEAVATVEDGTVTVLAVGETTIKASFAGDETYKKAEVSYTLTVQDSRQAINLSFAETSVTVNISETVDAPTLNGNTGNGAVTYESSNTDIATVDASGVVTGVAVGTATITATVAATNEYLGGTATFTVKVVDPNANDGSAEKPFTVAEAIAYINTLGSSTSENDVYVSGIISQVDNYNSKYFSITYWISDDGTTTTQMEVYSGKGLEGANFSSKDDLQVGDIVTVKGKVKMYTSNNKSIPEFDMNNQLVSLIRPVIPSITVDPVTVTVDAGEHDGTLALTYENLPITGMDDFDVQYYDAEGEEIDGPDWIEVLVAEQDPQIGEGYVVSYVIEENDGEARTAYFKIYALDEETNPVYTENLITISQEAYVAPEVTIGNFVKVTSTDDITSGQYLIVYEDGNLAFDGSRDDSNDKLDAENNTIDVTIENGKIAATATNAKSVFNIDVTAGTLQSASGKYIGVTSNSNGLKTSTDPEAYAHTFSIDEGENVVIAANFEGSTMTLRYNSASNQARFRYYKSGQQAVQLYKFVADAENATVTVTVAGYATYCSENDLDFSNTAIKAYKATISGTEVKFKEVKQVPAGEGVLLKADEGTYSVPVAAYAAANTDNVFVGVTEETVVNEKGIFVLMNPDGGKGVGFYKTTADSFTVGANTAYLPATAGARSFIGIDEATGIEGIVAEKVSNGEVYNLQGQRVTKAQKGLYIMDGKKVLVK